MPSLTVQSFGMLVPICGSTCSIEVPSFPITVEEGLNFLTQKFPSLEQHLSYVACAVGDQQVTRQTPLQAQDTLVLLPPVSGG